MSELYYCIIVSLFQIIAISITGLFLLISYISIRRRKRDSSTGRPGDPFKGKVYHDNEESPP